MAIAEDLRRCREQMARLGPLVDHATEAYALADARARARWEWVEDGVPVVELPVAALQDGLLEHNALAAAVRALQPSGLASSAAAPASASAAAAGGGGAVEHSWSSLATAEEGEALRGCRVLLSRAAPDRAVPDLALWRSWLVLVRHQRREVAVVCALRKFTPPHGAAFCRLTFGAAADVDGDGGGGNVGDEQGAGGVGRRLVAEVEAALEQWRPPPCAYDRAQLRVACERLNWSHEAAEHLRERPACGALLTQAAQAAASMVQHSCAPDADARAAQARNRSTGVG